MSVETKTFDSWPLGSALASTPDEINLGYARYIQDAVLDQPGITRQRGPVTELQAGSSGRRVVGLTGTYDSAGNYRALLIDTNGTNIGFNFINSPWTSIATTITFAPTGITIPVSGAAWMFDSKPAVGGGVVIGMAASDGPRVIASPADLLYLWKGATKAAYSTGTLQGVGTGATQVLGTSTLWVGNVEPGMFVYDKTSTGGTDGMGKFIGVVKSVDSNTQITLDRANPSTVAAASTYVIVPIRRLMSPNNAKFGRGFITCTTAAAGVTGSDTKWVDELLNSQWTLYRASDGAVVGTISTVTGQRGITLGANAFNNMDNEEYVLHNNTTGCTSYYLPTGSAGSETPIVGFLNASWQGQQWYANLGGLSGKGHALISRLWVSLGGGGVLDSISRAEADGSFFDIESVSGPSGIKALAPSESMLLVMKEEETYGISGTDVDSYQADRLLADGALSAMCVVPYENGCVWAGKKGIYLFDGRQVTNITDNNLGTFYNTLASTMDLSNYRAWAFIDRDHYFVHLEQVTIPTGYGVTKGAAGETQTGSIPFTICINLKTQAVTFMTNLLIRGSQRLPAANGGYNLYAVEKLSGGNTYWSLCKSSDLFADTTTADNITCRKPDGTAYVAGPDFYVENRLETADDEELLKLWKMLMMWHWNEGGSLTVDVVRGLGNDYATATTTLPQTTVVNGTGFQNNRIKFLKRAQYLGFRLYKSGGTASPAPVIFNETAASDDGLVFGSGGSYPPAFASATNNAQSDAAEKSQAAGPTFTLRNALYRWDTSSIPDNATILSASVSMYVNSKADNDNRNLVADWIAGSSWPIAIGLGANMTTGSALVTDITPITAGQVNTFTLLNPDANINRTGYTGLRFGVDGGSPALTNSVTFASQDNVSGFAKPQLTVTYQYTTVTTTRVKIGAWAIGFKRQRAGRV